MYFFGYGSSIKLRSSVLYHIGKRDKPAVYQTIRTNLNYYLRTALALSISLFIFSYQVAGLFCSDIEMRTVLSKMLKLFASFSTFDCSIPTMSTMLRIFDMNLYASLIIFFCFGFPFIFQNYAYVVYFELESFSPVVALLVCNIMIFVSSMYFILKYAKTNLDKKMLELDVQNNNVELLIQNQELDLEGGKKMPN